MIKIDKQAFAKDEFFCGTYDGKYNFTITRLMDFNTESQEYIISWVYGMPNNREEIENLIIEEFNK